MVRQFLLHRFTGRIGASQQRDRGSESLPEPAGAGIGDAGSATATGHSPAAPFSITMRPSPDSTGPPSAVNTAPNSTRHPAPTRTSPHSVAVGAT